MAQRFKLLLWVLMLILAWGIPAWSGTGENKNSLTLPYVAVGGAPDGWHLLTLVFLTNASNNADSGTIDFIDNNGQPLPVALNGDSELKADTSLDVPAGASKLLVLTHPDDVFRAGWLQINLSEKSDLRVTVIVRFYNSSSLIAEARIQTTPKHSSFSSYYMTAASGQESPPGNERSIAIRNRWAPSKGKA